MKKITKYTTFRFILLALFLILMHQIGQDSKSIVLIGLNPILNNLPLDFMNTGFHIPANTITGSISIYWYIACVISFIIYGLLIDLVRYCIKFSKDR